MVRSYAEWCLVSGIMVSVVAAWKEGL